MNARWAAESAKRARANGWISDSGCRLDSRICHAGADWQPASRRRRPPPAPRPGRPSGGREARLRERFRGIVRECGCQGRCRTNDKGPSAWLARPCRRSRHGETPSRKDSSTIPRSSAIVSAQPKANLPARLNGREGPKSRRSRRPMGNLTDGASSPVARRRRDRQRHHGPDKDCPYGEWRASLSRREARARRRGG